MNKLAEKEAQNYLPVIDSLTAHIVLVDKEANILVVNKSWKNFAQNNGYKIFGLYLGATIHDIGKIAIPSEMLCKPTKLSEIEYMLIHQHSVVGSDILKNIDFPWPIQKMIEQHHERINGSGYPYGLKGDKICEEAKIIAVADVFEAITSHRPYRPGKPRAVALKELIENKGVFYEAEVVEALLKLIKKGKLGKAIYGLHD